MLLLCQDAFTYIDRLEKQAGSQLQKWFRPLSRLRVWHKLFAFDQDQLISKSEFSTAFGFAATAWTSCDASAVEWKCAHPHQELAMFPYCVPGPVDTSLSLVVVAAPKSPECFCVYVSAPRWLHKHFANSSQAWAGISCCVVSQRHWKFSSLLEDVVAQGRDLNKTRPPSMHTGLCTASSSRKQVGTCVVPLQAVLQFYAFRSSSVYQLCELLSCLLSSDFVFDQHKLGPGSLLPMSLFCSWMRMTTAFSAGMLFSVRRQISLLCVGTRRLFVMANLCQEGVRVCF